MRASSGRSKSIAKVCRAAEAVYTGLERVLKDGCARHTRSDQTFQPETERHGYGESS